MDHCLYQTIKNNSHHVIHYSRYFDSVLLVFMWHFVSLKLNDLKEPSAELMQLPGRTTHPSS